MRIRGMSEEELKQGIAKERSTYKVWEKLKRHIKIGEEYAVCEAGHLNEGELDICAKHGLHLVAVDREGTFYFKVI